MAIFSCHHVSALLKTAQGWQGTPLLERGGAERVGRSITEDRHFDVLHGSGYKPQPITPEEFIRLHLSGG